MNPASRGLVVAAVSIATPFACALTLLRAHPSGPARTTSGTTLAAERQWPCSEWSDYRTALPDGEVQWSHRLCGAEAWADGTRSVDFRFRNETDRGIAIDFDAWLEAPADCGTPRPEWSGTGALAARETSAWNQYSFRLGDGRAYEDAVWLCARETLRSRVSRLVRFVWR